MVTLFVAELMSSLSTHQFKSQLCLEDFFAMRRKNGQLSQRGQLRDPLSGSLKLIPQRLLREIDSHLLVRILNLYFKNPEPLLTFYHKCWILSKEWWAESWDQGSFISALTLKLIFFWFWIRGCITTNGCSDIMLGTSCLREISMSLFG